MAERLYKVWIPANVALSLAFGFLGSYTTINLCEQYRLISKENCPKILSKPVLLVLMACTLGGVAIWAMHQVGMQAVVLYRSNGTKVKMQYSIGYLLISLFAVIMTSYIGLAISSKDKLFTLDETEHVQRFVKRIRQSDFAVSRKMMSKTAFIIRTLTTDILPLLLGGVVTGAGVCVMHYIGLASIVFDGELEYNAGIVFVSVVIAVVAASAAYWILFRLLAIYPYMESLRIASAIIAMIAVNGMHYTGMAAATFYYVEGKSSTVYHRLYAGETVVSETQVFYGSIVASLLLLWAISMAIFADLRSWFYSSSLTVRRTDELFAAVRYREINSDCGGSMPTLEKVCEDYTMIRNLENNIKVLKKGNLLLNTGGSDISSTNKHSGLTSSHSTHEIVPVDDNVLIDGALKYDTIIDEVM